MLAPPADAVRTMLARPAEAGRTMLARAAARHRDLLAKPGRMACLGPGPDGWPRTQV